MMYGSCGSDARRDSSTAAELALMRFGMTRKRSAGSSPLRSRTASLIGRNMSTLLLTEFSRARVASAIGTPFAAP
jgi:hypothetical protein